MTTKPQFHLETQEKIPLTISVAPSFYLCWCVCVCVCVCVCLSVCLFVCLSVSPWCLLIQICPKVLDWFCCNFARWCKMMKWRLSYMRGKIGQMSRSHVSKNPEVTLSLSMVLCMFLCWRFVLLECLRRCFVLSGGFVWACLEFSFGWGRRGSVVCFDFLPPSQL